MADREHADASAVSLSEVRATLLRVAHRLSSLEEASSPSKYLDLIFLNRSHLICFILELHAHSLDSLPDGIDQIVEFFCSKGLCL